MAESETELKILLMKVKEESEKAGLKLNIVKTKIMASCPICSHVQTWNLNHKECWALKNWCFWTVVLDKTLESPLDSKQIKPVNPTRNHPWIFIWRTDPEAEAPMWSWFFGKDLMLGKPEGRRRRGNRGWDGWMASSTQRPRVWANFWAIVKDREAGHATVHGVTESRTQLSNCTT